ncbi:uncharacterized protein LOC143300985 [Babylonia areolata]|uniref:uncharacterized protein LOC143300985 n=1 Tax=Babylonia areolata TaxID=304850 RepID=UPI003FD21C2C
MDWSSVEDASDTAQQNPPPTVEFLNTSDEIGNEEDFQRFNLIDEVFGELPFDEGLPAEDIAQFLEGISSAPPAPQDGEYFGGTEVTEPASQQHTIEDVIEVVMADAQESATVDGVSDIAVLLATTSESGTIVSVDEGVREADPVVVDPKGIHAFDMDSLLEQFEQISRSSSQDDSEVHGRVERAVPLTSQSLPVSRMGSATTSPAVTPPVTPPPGLIDKIRARRESQPQRRTAMIPCSGPAKRGRSSTTAASLMHARGGSSRLRKILGKMSSTETVMPLISDTPKTAPVKAEPVQEEDSLPSHQSGQDPPSQVLESPSTHKESLPQRASTSALFPCFSPEKRVFRKANRKQPKAPQTSARNSAVSGKTQAVSLLSGSGKNWAKSLLPAKIIPLVYSAVNQSKTSPYVISLIDSPQQIVNQSETKRAVIKVIDSQSASSANVSSETVSTADSFPADTVGSTVTNITQAIVNRDKKSNRAVENQTQVPTTRSAQQASGSDVATSSSQLSTHPSSKSVQQSENGGTCGKKKKDGEHLVSVIGNDKEGRLPPPGSEGRESLLDHDYFLSCPHRVMVDAKDLYTKPICEGTLKPLLGRQPPLEKSLDVTLASSPVEKDTGSVRKVAVEPDARGSSDTTVVQLKNKNVMLKRRPQNCAAQPKHFATQPKDLTAQHEHADVQLKDLTTAEPQLPSSISASNLKSNTHCWKKQLQTGVSASERLPAQTMMVDTSKVNSCVAVTTGASVTGGQSSVTSQVVPSPKSSTAAAGPAISDTANTVKRLARHIKSMVDWISAHGDRQADSNVADVQRNDMPVAEKSVDKLIHFPRQDIPQISPTCPRSRPFTHKNVEENLQHKNNGHGQSHQRKLPQKQNFAGTTGTAHQNCVPKTGRENKMPCDNISKQKLKSEEVASREAKEYHLGETLKDRHGTTHTHSFAGGQIDPVSRISRSEAHDTIVSGKPGAEAVEQENCDVGTKPTVSTIGTIRSNIGERDATCVTNPAVSDQDSHHSVALNFLPASGAGPLESRGLSERGFSPVWLQSSLVDNNGSVAKESPSPVSDPASPGNPARSVRNESDAVVPNGDQILSSPSLDGSYPGEAPGSPFVGESHFEDSVIEHGWRESTCSWEDMQEAELSRLPPEVPLRATDRLGRGEAGTFCNASLDSDQSQGSFTHSRSSTPQRKDRSRNPRKGPPPEVEKGCISRLPGYIGPSNPSIQRQSGRKELRAADIENMHANDFLPLEPSASEHVSVPGFNKLPSYATNPINSTQFDEVRELDLPRFVDRDDIPSITLALNSSPAPPRSFLARLTPSKSQEGLRTGERKRKADEPIALSRSSSGSSRGYQNTDSSSFSSRRSSNYPEESSDDDDRPIHGKRRKRATTDEEQTQKMKERRVVYVGGIPRGYTESELKKRFRNYGRIDHVRLFFREEQDNFGFVTFHTEAAASTAIEQGSKDPEMEFKLSYGGRREFCRSEYADLDGNLSIQEEYNPHQRKPVEDYGELLRRFKKNA